MQVSLVQGVSAKIGRHLLIFAAMLLIFSTNSVIAQTGLATITGTVTDQSGAIVSGASVTAKQNTTGNTVTSVTSQAGVYVINALPIGPYIVTVVAAGFKTESHSGLVLSSEQSATINFKLTVGTQSETISVEANSANLETETASIVSV